MIYLYICLFIHLFTFPPIYLSICLPVYLSTHLLVYLFTHLLVYISVSSPANMSISLSVYQIDWSTAFLLLPVFLFNCLFRYQFLCLPVISPNVYVLKLKYRTNFKKIAYICLNINILAYKLYQNQILNITYFKLSNRNYNNFVSEKRNLCNRQYKQ